MVSLSIRPLIAVAAVLGSIAVAPACDKCTQPHLLQPAGGYAAANYPGVIPVGGSQFPSYAGPQYPDAGSYAAPHHPGCSDPNCQSCPAGGVATPFGQAGGLNHQCTPACNHPAGYGHPAGCAGGNCQLHSHGATLTGSTLPALDRGRLATAGRPGICPVDGRPVGQFGPSYPVIVNGAVVHTCSGQCASLLRGYAQTPMSLPGGLQPQWSSPAPTLR